LPFRAGINPAPTCTIPVLGVGADPRPSFSKTGKPIIFGQPPSDRAPTARSLRQFSAGIQTDRRKSGSRLRDCRDDVRIRASNCADVYLAGWRRHSGHRRAARHRGFFHDLHPFRVYAEPLRSCFYAAVGMRYHVPASWGWAYECFGKPRMPGRRGGGH
jgi:hypothetical protein